MRANITFSTIREKLSSNMNAFYELGIEHVGILTIEYLGDDIEIYSVYDPQNPLLNYFKFQTIVEDMFPGYDVGFLTEEDIDFMLYQSVICYVQFVD